MTGPRISMHNSRLAVFYFCWGDVGVQPAYLILYVLMSCLSMKTWVREKREAAFPSLSEDPTGLRAITEALRELDAQEQQDVQAWWQWLNTPTQSQVARMSEHREAEALDDEYADLVSHEGLSGRESTK